MANTYRWRVTGVETYSSHDIGGGALEDAIYALEWELVATDAALNQAWIRDRVGITITPSAEYTARSQVDDGMLLGWAQAELGADGMAAVEARADAMLAETFT
jgi:hypothetical protein